MPLYDYVCSQGHTTEMRAGYDCIAIACPVCGELAHKQSFYPGVCIVTETGAGSGYGRTNAIGTETKDKHGRTRLSLVTEAMAERDHNHRKAEEIAQKPLPSKDLWALAKQRARTIGGNGHVS